MDIEEKILKYFYEIFPDVDTSNRNRDILEKLELDPEKDELEFEKAFDSLKDKNYIKLDRLMTSITFQGISYYENRYLNHEYYYLKAIKTLLEFIERLEEGVYPDDLIQNSEIIDKYNQEGITMNNMEFYQFILTLNDIDFFKYISFQSQESIHSYMKNKPLLTPKGREYLENWRSKQETFTKVTDNTQNEILLEEFNLLQKLVELGAWKDACVKMGSVLEYLLTIWLINKGIVPSMITKNETVTKWKDVMFSRMIDYYIDNSRKFKHEIGTSTDWKLVKNVLKDYRNFIHLQNYEDRVRKGDILRKKEFDRLYPIFQDIIKNF